MEYVEYDDYLFVPNDKTFDIEETLECGQVFRFKKTDFGYSVVSLSHKADIYCQQDGTKIVTKDKKYFIKYFDFDTNYDKILSTLGANPMLKSAVGYGEGIRILNADPLEMIISFIISQNNNIPRIKGIIEKICEAYGEDMGDYFAFPTLQKLKSIPLQFFKEIKCGYRDTYLFETIDRLEKDVFIEQIQNSDTENARKILMSLKGIGRKVADCILLFGFHRTDVFPVDTWLIKAYFRITGITGKPASDISKELSATFGDLSGFAQQYLFYYMREGN